VDGIALDIAIISLLLVISVVGIATRSSRLPYPIALVITGLVLGILVRSRLPFVTALELDQLKLTPHLILVLFLPALLFEAALHIEVTALRKTLLPIAVLAILRCWSRAKACSTMAPRSCSRAFCWALCWPVRST
jgi:CPA1 family monovalent cation:H+ antiporter